MNQPAGQFPFPCVFLTCFLLSVFISKVEKQSAGWHPAFLISRILPTRTPRNTTKSKNYGVANKKLTVFKDLSRICTKNLRRHKNFIRPTSACVFSYPCDAPWPPVCHFKPPSAKDIPIQGFGGLLGQYKNHRFRLKQSKLTGSKCVQVKGRVA